MKYQYEPLSDEYEFQSLLKDLFNAIYKTNSFEEYGSKGHAQFGVDIYSPEFKIAIQAKKKDINRTKQSLLKELFTDLESTTKLIEKFPHDINELYFATTTKKFIEIQDACFSFSNTSFRKFQFLSWADIQLELPKYPSVRNKYFPTLKESIVDKIDIALDIKEKLERLEKLLATQNASNLDKKKEYRSIPNCDIVLPLIDLESMKFVIAFILKVAAIESFVDTEYKKFICLLDFSSTYTQFDDGSSGPGFAIISGEVRFLGACIRLVRILQNNPDYFWEIYEEMKIDKKFIRVNFRMELLPKEGLTAYEFEIDGQVGYYCLRPIKDRQLDYEKLDSLNSVLPFIASTTKPIFHVIEFDKLIKYPAFTKFIYSMLIEDCFQLSAFRVNVNDFDDWDYVYDIPEKGIK